MVLLLEHIVMPKLSFIKGWTDTNNKTNATRFKKLFSKRWRKNGRQEFIFPFPGKLKLIQLKYFKFTTENLENGELKTEEDKNKYSWTLNNEGGYGYRPSAESKICV